MTLRQYRYYLLILLMLLNVGTGANELVNLTKNGTVPIWLVVGPFEQSLVGFGDAGDDDILVDVSAIPKQSQMEKSPLSVSGEVSWQTQSVNSDGFLDFNAIIGRTKPGKSPEKLWYALDAYAFSTIVSNKKQNIKFLIGSDSRMKIWLNGEIIYNYQNERGAKKDQDTVSVMLKKGENYLLTRVGNSQNNLIVDWFGGTPWGWGFYLRMATNENSVPKVKVALPISDAKVDCQLESTFFFKKINGELQQQIDVTIYSSYTINQDAILKLSVNDKTSEFDLKNIQYGENHREIYVPALENDIDVDYSLAVGGQTTNNIARLKKQKRYKLYVSITSHMDIGYTNTQPVVKERQIQTLLDVIEKCKKDPDFHWMIETPWVLDAFESTASNAIFDELLRFIKKGQIGISPIFTNPYTGWISTEDMIRCFDKAAEYHDKYNIQYPAAMVNDLPGLSWIIPQMLYQTGTKFLACGINEIYRDYQFQRHLPKVFYWEGGDESRVITYMNNAYTEGRYIGLEKSVDAVEQLLYAKLNRLQANDYPYDLVLINTAFSDNAGIPTDQYAMIGKWNSIYEYPKLISATLGEFAEKFEQTYAEQIPVLKGDWTSDWDILFQSEPKEFIHLRKVQHQILSAEKLSTINWLKDPRLNSPSETFKNSYELMLNFAGHGSGLEFGFGTPEENFKVMAFRKGNVDQAALQTEALTERALYRFAKSQAGFENEGAIVFNPLSWNRDAIVEMSFIEGRRLTFKIVDLMTGQAVPYFAKGHKLWFIARDLPAMGYKKFQIKSVYDVSEFKDTDLSRTSNSIENHYYRVEYDPETGELTKIVDKQDKQNLVGKTKKYSFAGAVVKQGITRSGFHSLKSNRPEIEIIDKRPVCLTLKIQKKGNLFESTDITLWANIDRVDLSQAINLEKLPSTEKVEEYGLAFPFEMKKTEPEIEIIGGYLKPDQRLPGINHNAYSIRRTVTLHNGRSSIIWASIDRQVMRLEYDHKRPVIISNVVNNFPKAWNRHQDNTGTLNLNYSFTRSEKGFDPGESSRFGWEILTPPLIQEGWFSLKPAAEQYCKIDNDQVILLDIKVNKEQSGWLMELMNVNPDLSQDVSVTSKYLENKTIKEVDFLNNDLRLIKPEGNKITITIKPNQILNLHVVGD